MLNRKCHRSTQVRHFCLWRMNVAFSKSGRACANMASTLLWTLGMVKSHPCRRSKAKPVFPTFSACSENLGGENSSATMHLVSPLRFSPHASEFAMRHRFSFWDTRLHSVNSAIGGGATVASPLFPAKFMTSMTNCPAELVTRL